MTAYYSLIASLPHLGLQYKIKQPPISERQLVKRLNLLNETDKLLLDNVIEVVWLSWFKPEVSFKQTLAKSQSILELNNPFLNELINWFFDIRSIFVALQLRQSETKIPDKTSDFWKTRWSKKMQNAWQKPDLGLKYVFPWIVPVNTAFLKGDMVAVEEIFLSLIWKQLEKLEAGHYFDLEALLIYLLRWHIVNYWSQFNEKIALDRIQKYSDDLLNSYQSQIKEVNNET
jgi:hypothetical protein